MCDSGFNNAAAGVACRVLNSSWAFGRAVYGAGYGKGQGLVLLTYLMCSGREQSLLECAPDPSQHNDCTHENDVGVVCLPEGSPAGVAAPCHRQPLGFCWHAVPLLAQADSSGAWPLLRSHHRYPAGERHQPAERPAGGANRSLVLGHGELAWLIRRLQEDALLCGRPPRPLRHPAPARPQVCSGMQNVDARAACRGMGHPYGRIADPPDAFGPGTGAVAINAVSCPAGAASLNSCDYALGAWNPQISETHSAPCGHDQDVSIECYDEPPGAGGWCQCCAAPRGWCGVLGSPLMPCGLLKRAPSACPQLAPACAGRQCAEPITGIRLANGTASSGRLEVQADSYGWGTVRSRQGGESGQQQQCQLLLMFTALNLCRSAG